MKTAMKRATKTAMKPAIKTGAVGAAQLDHVALEVRDLEATVAFYEKILKFPPVRLQEYRDGDAPFASGRVNGTTLIDYFPREMWNNRRRQDNPNHICLTLSEGEVTGLKRRLARSKIPIVRRLPVSFGAQGWGNSIYFEDPDGVTVEVRYYGKDAQKNLSAKAQRAQASVAKAAIASTKQAKRGAGAVRNSRKAGGKGRSLGPAAGRRGPR